MFSFRKLYLALFLTFFTLNAYGAPEPVWDALSEPEQGVLNQILTHWETWIPARKTDGSAPLITFEDLYQGLNKDQTALLDRIRKIDPQKSFNFQGGYLGESSEGIEFVKIADQPMKLKEGVKPLDPQYLPVDVFAAYQQMSAVMQKELGKKLLVESGYRSPAYQLYTFCFYMPKHHYSLVETGHWIAIPGYSEHGAPQQQAIDFINEEGINGEDHVEDFEALPEYAWLLKNAGRFGFELSYPRDKKGITFEPWHWRFVKSAEQKQGV